MLVIISLLNRAVADQIFFMFFIKLLFLEYKLLSAS